MTPSEAKDFFEKVFVAFPGLKEWLKSIGDPSSTVAVWSRTLNAVTSEEAMTVLDGWIDGSIANPPVGYRREMFALEVKSLVMQVRSELRKERDREEQWIKSNRGKYQPTAAFRSIAKPFMQMLANKELVMAGEMSVEEYDRQVDIITEQAFEKSAQTA